MRHKGKSAPELGQLRIIGGSHRGRKLTFPALDGVRPTPDRVRETLFNWLMPIFPGPRCLDVFCGSGALGLEALSRGAADVTFIDQSPVIASHLKSQIQLLRADNASVASADALSWLRAASPNKPWEVVFLDPPFRKEFLAPALQILAERRLLAANAYVYIEAEVELNPLPLPPGWAISRHKTAGQVQYALCLVRQPD
ncbi:16S rRNA (guanine(966)-N(2))-methyltransferase RsmD [Hahella sp. KA22]|uniref:16S rRNA (guanine(966)-N(2))-methyltransferase RsmD n=1 Tax=Hahella sp. KA22 TaxID=1628392 RepID=UPI000FDD6DF5|nr:16S rRNA (guanine(966)-N(2))-methyltransferase RsmD [Hahella sp. KA22]AZZ90091.1 16S rRNA (guanine(966)-N(2))-methyltransferase RsmD [Hahella sp. KA22]QAY53461.1 16S rRNA (guanine(966)-N(2))-methyltransferase RsmD [Hahella sp. KA22]